MSDHSYGNRGLIVKSAMDTLVHNFVTRLRSLSFDFSFEILKIKPFEPPHGKTNNLHMRKQRRRSASR